MTQSFSRFDFAVDFSRYTGTLLPDENVPHTLLYIEEKDEFQFVSDPNSYINVQYDGVTQSEETTTITTSEFDSQDRQLTYQINFQGSLLGEIETPQNIKLRINKSGGYYILDAPLLTVEGSIVEIDAPYDIREYNSSDTFVQTLTTVDVTYSVTNNIITGSQMSITAVERTWHRYNFDTRGTPILDFSSSCSISNGIDKDSDLSPQTTPTASMNFVLLGELPNFSTDGDRVIIVERDLTDRFEMFSGYINEWSIRSANPFVHALSLKMYGLSGLAEKIIPESHATTNKGILIDIGAALARENIGLVHEDYTDETKLLFFSDPGINAIELGQNIVSRNTLNGRMYEFGGDIHAESGPLSSTVDLVIPDYIDIDISAVKRSKINAIKYSTWKTGSSKEVIAFSVEFPSAIPPASEKQWSTIVRQKTVQNPNPPPEYIQIFQPEHPWRWDENDEQWYYMDGLFTTAETGTVDAPEGYIIGRYNGQDLDRIAVESDSWIDYFNFDTTITNNAKRLRFRVSNKTPLYTGFWSYPPGWRLTQTIKGGVPYRDGAIVLDVYVTEITTEEYYYPANANPDDAVDLDNFQGLPQKNCIEIARRLLREHNGNYIEISFTGLSVADMKKIRPYNLVQFPYNAGTKTGRIVHYNWDKSGGYWTGRVLLRLED